MSSNQRLGQLNTHELIDLVHYKEINYDEKQEYLNNFKKNDVLEVKIIEVKDEKIRLVGEKGTQNILDAISNNCKIITTCN